MDGTIAILRANTPDQLRELYTWLSAEPELRGLLRLAEASPPPGALGGAVESVQVLLGAPVAVVVGGVVAWLRYRTSDVRIKVRATESATEVELNAHRLSSLDSAGIKALTEQITLTLAQERQNRE
ncbi:effector-associated constant component EACC1 [Nonomuraea sediminis]|uniref:effector-associated constant component EACC1 n=1 Tax=Nonomuraea sediminis TaxID=2835864 RepID=UPI001BDCDAAA|nr:hypothetical protein [Nonomuraea sediminis]